MVKTQNKSLVPAPSQEEVEDRDLALDSRTLEDQAREKLDPELLRRVKKIAYYTSENGLNLEEACMLADINYEQFQELLVDNSLVRKIIDMKKLQYKKDLLYTISQKAREGDDKLALWLLERMYPEEFYMSKKKAVGTQSEDEDILFQAISFIQKHGDNNPLVRQVSGRAVIIKKTKGASGENIVKQLEDILK